jgi:hypothetical protein
LRDEEVVYVRSGAVKMSRVLADFVAPYEDTVDTVEGYRKLVTIAAVAWNASFFPEEEQQEMLDSAIQAGVPAGEGEVRAGLKELVDTLIVRKNACFSEYARMIIEFEVVSTGEGYHLTVASTPEEAA